MIKQSAAFAGLGLLAWTATGHAVPTSLHAKAWTDAGKIVHSTDTLQVNYNGNWQQSIGMQFHGSARLGEHWEGGLGFGLSQIYHSSGSQDEERFTLSKYFNYVSEARVSYASEDGPNPMFAVDLGNFAFNYAPHVKNLGLYLFRGPVYPGFLVSGFKEFHTDTTRATFLGVHLQNGIGNFRQDLIFSSERDLPPSFDWSLGYVARYKAFNALEIGAGANFYHLFAENADITDPNRGTANGLFNKDDALYADTATKFHPYELQYYEALGPGDTIVYTHRGIKVMGMASLDIKRLLGLEAPFGEKDLLLYGETALIGVKNYGTVYAKRGERMPFMVGLNLPAFGLLDFLSIEVERYTARFKADYSKLGYDRSLYFKNIAAPKVYTQKNPSAIPISAKDLADEKYTILANGDFVNTQSGDTIQVKGTALDPENMTEDNIKWSVNLEKTLGGHVQFSGQIANDHFVARPVRNGLISEAGGMSEAFSSLKDWYFMFRVGYFF